jgi:hypothetical protein
VACNLNLFQEKRIGQKSETSFRKLKTTIWCFYLIPERDKFTSHKGLPGNSNPEDAEFDYICCSMEQAERFQELSIVFYRTKSFRICFKR